jgi:hypothetical protein
MTRIWSHTKTTEPLTALERFIYDNEPAGNEPVTAFRGGLSEVLRENAKAQAPMPAPKDYENTEN